MHLCRRDCLTLPYYCSTLDTICTLQVAGTYADIKFAHGGFGAGQNFAALFRCVVAALNDTQLPVN